MSCFTTGPETVEPRWPWTETSKVLNQNKPSLLLFKVFLPQWQEGNTFRILISEEKPHLRCLLIKYFFLDSLPMYARLALSQNISALQITSGCIILFFFFEFCTLSNTIYISHCEGLEKKKVCLKRTKGPVRESWGPLWCSSQRRRKNALWVMKTTLSSSPSHPTPPYYHYKKNTVPLGLEIELCRWQTFQFVTVPYRRHKGSCAQR